MNILITDCDHGFFDPEERVVRQHGHSLRIAKCRSPEDVVREAGGADALICQRVLITREALEALPRVRVVGRYGSGVDNVDLNAATECGVRVVYAPYFCFVDVANHALGMILAVSRYIASISAQWKRDPHGFVAAYDERIKRLINVKRPTEVTLGIVGFGKIGSQVARRASAFGFRLVAADPYVSDQVIAAYGATKLPLDAVFQESDIITFHVPLTPETKHMADRERIGRMRRGSFLVNVSRGPVVCEEALIEALHTGQLAGAALDVTEEEPLAPDSPLLAIDNVILTPHVAFYSESSLLDLKSRVAEYTMRALSGDNGYELANPGVLQHPALRR